MQRISQQTVSLVQRRLGVEPDGIEGPETRAKLAGMPISKEVLKTLFPGIDVSLDEQGDPEWGRWLDLSASVHGCTVPGVSGSFIPHGVMIHHTAGPTGRKEVPWEMFQKGRPDLQGPLANVVVARDGTTHFMTNGRANHAGIGDGRVLEAVKKDAPHLVPARDDTYGNSHFFGIEIDNDGKGEIYPAVQLNAAALVAAGWCHFFGWRSNRVIGHKEWTLRKTDPSFDMTRFRAYVNDGIEALNRSKPSTSFSLQISAADRLVALEQRVLELEKRLK